MVKWIQKLQSLTWKCRRKSSHGGSAKTAGPRFFLEVLTMTPEERFAENENLAYYILHTYFPRYTFDEDLKQISTMWLWKACRDGKYDPAKGKFSTFAAKYIKMGILTELHKRKQYIQPYSLDELLYDSDSPVYWIDTIVDRTEYYDNAEQALDLAEFAKTLTPVQKDVFEKLINDIQQVEIAADHNVTRNAIHMSTKVIRKKLNRYLDLNKEC